MTLVLLTALGVGGATVIGAIIGFLTEKISHQFSDIVLGFAAGIMLCASVVGLILPSVEKGSVYVTILGIFIGAIVLNLIDKFTPNLHNTLDGAMEEHHPESVKRHSKIMLLCTKNLYNS